MATTAASSRLQPVQKPQLEAPIPKLPVSMSQALVQTATTTKSTWESVRDNLSQLVRNGVRDTFFLPLPFTLTPSQATQQRIEEAFVESFFDLSRPLDPNFKGQPKIREHFTVSDQKISVRGREGQPLLLTCRVLESKQTSSDKVYNFVLVAGNLTTPKNNIVGVYSYLDAFLAQTHSEPVVGRFIIISQYGLEQVGAQDAGSVPYKAATLDEAGYVLTQALLALKREYGEIDQVVAHSLGCMVLAAGLKYLPDNQEAAPRHLLFDRGPSSVKELAAARWGGSFLIPLAEQVGWSVDIGQELQTYCTGMPSGTEEPTVLVSGVVHDHYFSGAANLCLSGQVAALKTMNKVAVLCFNPPVQVVHERAHHSLRADALHAGYLVSPSSQDYLRGQETLADSVMRRSLERVTDLTFLQTA